MIEKKIREKNHEKLQYYVLCLISTMERKVTDFPVF